MVVGIPNGLLSNIENGPANGLTSSSQRTVFEIETTNLPGVAFGTDEIRLQGYGPFTRKPYVSIFDTINIVVRSDTENITYDFFQSWMKLISNYDTSTGIAGSSTSLGSGRNSGIGRPYEVAYSNDYTVNSIINVYDPTSNEPSLAITLLDCYPIHVGTIPLNWADNSIVKFPVTLTFTDWYQNKNIRAANNVTTENSIPFTPIS